MNIDSLNMNITQIKAKHKASLSYLLMHIYTEIISIQVKLNMCSQLTI